MFRQLDENDVQRVWPTSQNQSGIRWNFQTKIQEILLQFAISNIFCEWKHCLMKSYAQSWLWPHLSSLLNAIHRSDDYETSIVIHIPTLRWISARILSTGREIGQRYFSGMCTVLLGATRARNNPPPFVTLKEKSQGMIASIHGRYPFDNERLNKPFRRC